MKLVPLKEAEARLEHYGELCQEEPVVITIDGVPAFQLTPLDDDQLVDELIENNPRFRQLLEARRREPRLSAEELLRRLDQD